MDLRPIRSPEWPTCPAVHLRPAVLDLVAEPRRDRRSRLATLARRRSRYRHLGGCRAHSGEAWLREGPTQRRPSCGFDISASAVTRQPRRAPTNSMPLIHLTIVRPSWTSLRGRTGAPWWNDGEAARSLSYAPASCSRCWQECSPIATGNKATTEPVARPSIFAVLSRLQPGALRRQRPVTPNTILRRHRRLVRRNRTSPNRPGLDSTDRRRRRSLVDLTRCSRPIPCHAAVCPATQSAIVTLR